MRTVIACCLTALLGAVAGPLPAQETDPAEAYGIYRPPPATAPAASRDSAPRDAPPAPAAAANAASDVTDASDSSPPGRRPPVVTVVAPPATAPAPPRDTAAASAEDTLEAPETLRSVEVAGQDTSLTARMDATRGGGLRREEFPDLWESAQLARHYTVFLELMSGSGRGGALADSVPVTVLAPTDSAFGRLPPEDLARLRNDSAALERWAAAVLVDGDRSLAELLQAGVTGTRGGTVVRLSRGPDGIAKAGTARVVQPDVLARHGRLHGVDRVTLPAAGPDSAATSAAP